MRKTLIKLSLAAALTALTFAAHSQTNVWHDDFDQFPVGANSDDSSYGAVAFNFTAAGFGHPFVMITNNNPDTLPGDPSYTHSNNIAFVFNTDPTVWTNALNFGLRIGRIPVIGGNTSTSLRDYILNFDVAVQPVDLSSIGGFVGAGLGVYGNNSGEYFGDGAETNIPLSVYPAAGSGWVHYSMNLGSFNTAHAAALNPTDGTFSFFIDFFMAGHSYPGNVEIDFANISITMSNQPPPPPPTMSIIKTKPALRIFSQNHAATYNQEGFGTVDANQSWIGVATPSNPVSYSVKFADFDTVNNYTFFAQFLQNGNGGDPFGVYNGQNALVWQITHQDTGFTTRIDWKTNAPQAGQNNNALPFTTTTSTNGRGTWTLTFTSDIDGTVTAPDGTSTPFTLPDDPTWKADFANPMVIDFATAPNNTAGYGQYIDIAQIAISNVLDGTEFDDFTKDDTLNTSLWNPGFSIDSANATDAGSVFQISTNTPYWINWTLPDDGFGLATAPDLKGGPIGWVTPTYYGNAYGRTNTLPTSMGGVMKWTLIPNTALPTTDGNAGGAVAPNAFFRLQNPVPTQ
jgi:hypothetical protein